MFFLDLIFFIITAFTIFYLLVNHIDLLGSLLIDKHLSLIEFQALFLIDGSVDTEILQ